MEQGVAVAVHGIGYKLYPVCMPDAPRDTPQKDEQKAKGAVQVLKEEPGIGYR
jgi:hypothetical protein